MCTRVIFAATLVITFSGRKPCVRGTVLRIVVFFCYRVPCVAMTGHAVARARRRCRPAAGGGSPRVRAAVPLAAGGVSARMRGCVRAIKAADRATSGQLGIVTPARPHPPPPVSDRDTYRQSYRLLVRLAVTPRAVIGSLMGVQ